MSETLNFGTAPAPQIKSGRAVEPNPFDDHFPTKVDENGQALALTLSFKGTAEANKAKVTNLTGKARRAAERIKVDGQPHPMTARVNVIEQGTGNKTETVVYFWTVEKITRQTADQTADGQPATE